jgi:hypothetical protein
MEMTARLVDTRKPYAPRYQWQTPTKWKDEILGIPTNYLAGFETLADALSYGARRGWDLTLMESKKE